MEVFPIRGQASTRAGMGERNYEEGMAQTPVLAPRLKTDDVKGRSLMIHLMGDNFSDDPQPLGGGGARLACGVIAQ